MKTIYIDCSMGAAGDMLSAALLELTEDPAAFIEEVNALRIPNVRVSCEPSQKCGISGTHVTVKAFGQEEDEHLHDHDHDHDHHHEHHHDHDHDHHHDHEHEHHHEHHHSGMHEIEHIVRDLAISESVKEHVLAIYGLIAEAESKAHNRPVSEIHFHEVGTMDAVADVTMACLLMEKLSPQKVIASPVHVGSGHVHCAHGILPVPAPATAYILRDVPIYGGEIQGELCTPTGAAILKHFVDEFGSMPPMKTEKIGYGMGKKDFPKANCVRVLMGEAESSLMDPGVSEDVREKKAVRESVVELSCNLDDMTPEAIGFAMELLLENGALDVFTTPIGMKKNRPGVKLSVLCHPSQEEDLVHRLFENTSTLGIRRTVTERYVLDRRDETTETELGHFRKKLASGFGVAKEKWEYDDLARAAKEYEMSLEDVKKALEAY